MVLGPSVETKEEGQGEVGTMPIIKYEHVPSCCGVVVEAEIQECKGTVMVKPWRKWLLSQISLEGHCKIWTLDSGPDRGLDGGLDFGPDFGQKF